MKTTIISLIIVATLFSSALVQAASYYTGFEDGATKSSYAIGNVALSNVWWTLDSCVVGTLSLDKKEENCSLRMAYNGAGASSYTGSTYMIETLTGNFSSVSFKYASYGTSSIYPLDGRLATDISTDDGATWNNLSTIEVHTSDQALTPLSTTFGPYQYVRLRFRFWIADVTCTYSRNRMNVDNVELVPEPSALLLGGVAVAGLLAFLRRK